MERSEGLSSSSYMDVSASSALHISEDAFWDEVHQSLPLHFRKHLPERHLFKKEKKKRKKAEW